MSAKRILVFVLPILAVVASGCSGTFVAKDRYDQDLQSLKDYSAALERRNLDLEAQLSGLKKVVGEAELVSRENRFYEEIAGQIEAWLKTSQIDSADVHFDPKTGKWTMAADVLFDSGSYSISPKGSEILKAFAAAHVGKNVRFRIAGHTDRDPIVRPATKQALPVSHVLNLELSALRAVSVAYELKLHGVSENDMFVEAYGNTQPIASNDRDPSNKKKNRRVEIYVLKDLSGK